MTETRKIDGEKKATAATAKAVRYALEEKIAGDVHVIIKVGQGGVRKIESFIHAVFDVAE